LQYFRKMVVRGLLNIQKLQSIKPSCGEYHLVMLIGLWVEGSTMISSIDEKIHFK